MVLTEEGSDEVFAGCNFVIGDYLRQEDLLTKHMFPHLPLPTASERSMKLEQLSVGPRQDLVSVCDELLDHSHCNKLLGGMSPPVILQFTMPSYFYSKTMVRKYGLSNLERTIAENIPPKVTADLVSGETHALNEALVRRCHP